MATYLQNQIPLYLLYLLLCADGNSTDMNSYTTDNLSIQEDFCLWCYLLVSGVTNKEFHVKLRAFSDYFIMTLHYTHSISIRDICMAPQFLFQ